MKTVIEYIEVWYIGERKDIILGYYYIGYYRL